LAPDSDRNSDLPDGCRPGFALKNNEYIPVDTEAFETSMHQPGQAAGVSVHHVVVEPAEEARRGADAALIDPAI
jgi:hypothetical protein